MKIAKCLILVGAFLCGVGHCNAQTWNEEKAARVRQAFTPLVGYSVKSMAVSISIDGVQVFAEGFGNAKPGMAADGDTVYHIGSVTKQFTAAAILSLIDDGATVKYDNSIFSLNSTMPLFFEGVEPRWNGITVQSLLTMSSGIPDFLSHPPPMIPFPLNANSQASSKDMLAAFKSYWPASPGVFNYSNTNYFLLGQIIEVISSNKLHEYLAKRVFSAAGMENTGFIDDYPSGVVADPAYGPGGTAFSKPDWPKGAGDIATSVNDLHKWNVSLLGGKVISQSHVDQMFTPYTPTPNGSIYCMGWFNFPHQGRLQYTHSGEIPGYHSINVLVRDKATGHLVDFSILTSSPKDPGLDAMARDLVNWTFAQ